MKEKITLEGRSMVFNMVFIALNIIGLTFLVAGYHDSAISNSTLYKSIGWILMLLSVGGLVMFKGKLMMSGVSRVLVGGLFIVSGLVKANDPIGFSYKLEEYFEDGALAYRIKELFGTPGFSMEYFIEWALFLSVLVCIFEIVLGVLIIIGGKVKLVSYLMLIMMIFFTFLTWHTSTCDAEARFLDHDTYVLSDYADAASAKMKLEEAKMHRINMKADKAAAKEEGKKYQKLIWVVSKTKEEVVIAEMKTPQCVADCGCFGDAMKGSVGRSLTPKESLWKDLVLLYLVIWIFVAQWIIKPNSRKQNLVMISSSMGVVVFFSWIFGWYFPVFFALAGIIGSLWMLRVGGKWFDAIASIIISIFFFWLSDSNLCVLFGFMSVFVIVWILRNLGGQVGKYYSAALALTLLCIFMVTYVLMYNPIKDYRPYAVGSDLHEKMKDGVKGEYEYFYYLTDLKTGKKKRVPMSEITQDMWGNPERWKADFDKTDCVVEPVNASIMDFRPSIDIADLSKAEMKLEMIQTFVDTNSLQMIRIRDNYDSATYDLTFEEYNLDEYPPADYPVLDTLSSYPEDVFDIDAMDAIINAKRIVIIISKSLEEGNWSNIGKLKKLHAACKKKGVPFIMICNASREDINKFRKKNKFNVATFAMDEIELKIISRSNPTVVVLEKGVVKGKYPFRSTPSVESFKSNHLK
ncbi:MAG: DoxX family protein [Crocinitomicaceae bacterium]|nr:DoxX family protein [Crocinitomicaceae bacterium]